MNILKTVLICSFALYFLVYMILLIKTKKPFKNLFLFAFLGIFATLLINLTSPLSGVIVPVNPVTTVVICFLGVPGVTALLILPFIFV